MSYTIEMAPQEEKLLCIDNSLVLVMLKVEIPLRALVLWAVVYAAMEELLLCH